MKDGMLEDKKAGFLNLFREFLNSYPSTEFGRIHTAHYNEERKAAQKNLESIIAASGRGEDVTEKVLLHLLPYADSKQNQDMGYWISIAPAFNCDVRKKYEPAGWTKPEDWPRVAQAILKFVRRCYENPEDLASACAEFNASPYSKGFQAGTLTPILHALKPDDFILINSKSKHIINYFAGTSYSQGLNDYPELNRVARSLVNELSEEIHQFEMPDIRDDDLIDMFGHWLVAIKKYFVGKKNFSKIIELIDRIQSILERKGQVILYGPPGTGKTYWAENAATKLAAQSNFQKRFDQLSDHERSSITGDGESFGVVRTCCFHPAYGYEDFIEGYRPEQADGQMRFSLREGVFKRLCKDALENPQKNFYLIIDEINRGDIPRIFGELMTIIEKDKRGKSITLPSSGEQFKVPNNVFIIGTMNTADRSIALLDAALRRRFGFIEMMPDPSVLGGAIIEGIHLGRWLEALNQKICKNVARDARNLQIGHSYLLRDDGTPIDDFSEFARALHEDIIPLLEEYCYEDYNTLEKILGPGIVEANDLRIRHELFKASAKDELLQVIGQILLNISEE